MFIRNNLELSSAEYEQAIDTMISNGNRVSTQIYGSRKILHANSVICGYSKVESHLPLSEELTSKQFYNFLASFKRSLYHQIEKKNYLLSLDIQYDGLSKFKNDKGWKKLKSPEKFYTIDINSAYWQFAYRLGYISKQLYIKYMDRKEYKEVKRYAISFLARENEMVYFDNREINVVSCDISAFKQIYDNIRNEMYRTIDTIAQAVPNFIEQNIDSISVSAKDLEFTKAQFEKMGLKYKVQEAVKVDKTEYFINGKYRKF
jgi:hypothetical protein